MEAYVSRRGFDAPTTARTKNGKRLARKCARELIVLHHVGFSGRHRRKPSVRHETVYDLSDLIEAEISARGRAAAEAAIELVSDGLTVGSPLELYIKRTSRSGAGGRVRLGCAERECGARCKR